MMRKKNVALIAFGLAMLLFLAGCAQNKYVPCCSKEDLYDTTQNPPVLKANPPCVLSDNTHYAANCRIPANPSAKGVVECEKDGCSDLSNERDCEATVNCVWSDNACSGGTAIHALPVCVDNAPKSCVNDRCTAMMCGYTSAIAKPPLASQDWDTGSASNAMAQNELSFLPSINLQGTQCKLSTMTKKLYNQVAKSQGQLWVNSFRFGVGKSFSDYEQSKYFFPASDKGCGINPQGTVDRFTVYLNEPGTWCNGIPIHYHCTKNGLNFSSRDTCGQYCGGNPTNCQTRNSPQQYRCLGDNMAYPSREMCKQNCDIIEDPTACTVSQAASPYLGNDGRYKVKYVADYLVDTWKESSSDGEAFDETCIFKAGIFGARAFSGWDPDHHYYCNDYYPGTSMGTAPSDGPWAWWRPNGELRTYFEARKSPALDFNFEYYAQALRAQYETNPASLDVQLPFECSSGLECISGSCDTADYKRGLCVGTDGSTTYGCDCRKERLGQQMKLSLACYQQTSGLLSMVYAELGSTFNGLNKAVVVGNSFFDEATEYARTPASVRFRYYAPVSGGKPKLFEKCGVSPAPQPVKKCIGYQAAFGLNLGGLTMVIANPVNGNCGSSGMVHTVPAPEYYFYDITFNQGSSLGNCMLEDPLQPPYVQTKTMGWCAGCTYSTLAVQKIDWNNGPGGNYPGVGNFLKSKSCYEWRGEMDYSVSSGRNPASLLRASSSEVRKNAGGDPLNGNIERDRFDSPWIGSDSVAYACNDQWHNNAWWYQGAGSEELRVPYPSAPYLRDKLTSYLQSNVMPILDEQSGRTDLKYELRKRLPQCTRKDDISEWYCGNLPNNEFNLVSGPYYSQSECNQQCFARTFPSPFRCERGYTCSSNSIRYESQSKCASKCAGQPCSPTAREKWECNLNRQNYDSESICTSLCKTAGFDWETVLAGTSYDPKEVCNNYGGDGSPIHVIGNTGMLGAPSGFGKAYLDPGEKPADLISYIQAAKDPVTGTYNDLDGTSALIIRADILKTECKTPPLIGLAINGNEDLSTLVGSPPGPSGKLHNFFYTPRENQYEWRVANGMPDKYPGKVDVLLQEWHPVCGGSGGLAGTCTPQGIAGSCSASPMHFCDSIGPYPGSCPGTCGSVNCLNSPSPYYICSAPGSGYNGYVFETQAQCQATCPRQTHSCSLNGINYPTQSSCQAACVSATGEEEEIEGRIEFSRSLLSNFSRPSLIWKFHFPQNSQCNHDVFLDYLFKNTGRMVDAGIVGLVYDSWMTEDGRGYGEPTENIRSNFPDNSQEEYSIYTGLSNVKAEGRLDDPQAGKANSAFCSLQEYSKRILGITKYTYGQKLYGTDEHCECAECSENDYAFGYCDLNAQDIPTINQLICNDGFSCVMPGGRTDYGNFFCPRTCVDSGKCVLCSQSSYQSFCRMDQVGEQPAFYTKPYDEITPDYWEFLAGLPAGEKCCLVQDIPDLPSMEYTYIKRSGQKSRSEFLQFPSRGELAIDCGRTPDTSVLIYCNVAIPIEQKDINCFRTT